MNVFSIPVGIRVAVYTKTLNELGLQLVIDVASGCHISIILMQVMMMPMKIVPDYHYKMCLSSL